jgi:hypothetical protein
MVTRPLVLVLVLFQLGLSLAEWPQLIHPNLEDYYRSYSSPQQDPYASPSYSISIASSPSDEPDVSQLVRVPYIVKDDVSGREFRLEVVLSVNNGTSGSIYGSHSSAEMDFSLLETDIDRVNYAKKLLGPLGRTVLSLQESWWTYEYQHLENVKQVHSGLLYTTEHVLGSYDGSNEPNWLFSSPLRSSKNISTDIPSITISYTNGDVCDVIGSSRTTLVEFRCKPGEGLGRISNFHEYSSCKYWVLVETPLLCADPHFSKASIKPQRMQCMISEPLSSDVQSKAIKQLSFLTDPIAAFRGKLRKSRSESEALLPRPAKIGKDPLEALLSAFGFGSTQTIQDDATSEGQSGTSQAISQESGTDKTGTAETLTANSEQSTLLSATDANDGTKTDFQVMYVDDDGQVHEEDFSMKELFTTLFRQRSASKDGDASAKTSVDNEKTTKTKKESSGQIIKEMMSEFIQEFAEASKKPVKSKGSDKKKKSAQ